MKASYKRIAISIALFVVIIAVWELVVNCFAGNFGCKIYAKINFFPFLCE